MVTIGPTTEANWALAMALVRAQQRGYDDTLGLDDLLVALLSQEGTFARALVESSGADPGELRTAIEALPATADGSKRKPGGWIVGRMLDLRDEHPLLGRNKTAQTTGHMLVAIVLAMEADPDWSAGNPLPASDVLLGRWPELERVYETSPTHQPQGRVKRRVWRISPDPK